MTLPNARRRLSRIRKIRFESLESRWLLAGDSIIQGSKWNDLNENGIRDGAEPGLAGWTMYVDSNTNGQRDAGEPSAVTASDGSYAITGLDAGRHLVSEVPQSGWEQTFPTQNTYPITAITGQPGDGFVSSDNAQITSNGRYVVFESRHATLGNAFSPNIFVLDRQTGLVDRVSRGLNNTLPNSSVQFATISDDGRYIAYQTSATNIASTDTSSNTDVFLFDRGTSVTTQVSVGAANSQSNGNSRFPKISGNGQFIVFESTSSNLVALDTNGTSDVFLYTVATGAISLISKSSGGIIGSAESGNPAISFDGSKVVFASSATNLESPDTNGVRDIFVHTVATGVTQLVSKSAGGAQGNQSSEAPTISGDARYVAFWSNASNLVTTPPTNMPPNVHLVDLQTGSVELVSIGTNGLPTSDAATPPALSFDGRYVVFATASSSATPSLLTDVMWRDRTTGTTRRISRAATGVASGGASSSLDITADGQTVLFASIAKNLVATDNNYSRDVFVVDASFPWQPGTQRVELAASATAGSIDFGNAVLDGDLSGALWQDTNRNGVQDSGEQPLVGRQIYIDSNNDSQFNPGEPTVVTGSAGEYAFGSLVPGSYVIRQILPANWLEYKAPTGYTRVVGQSRTITFDFEELAFNSSSSNTISDYVRDGFVISTAAAGPQQWRIYGTGSVPARPSTDLEAVTLRSIQYLHRNDGQAFTALRMTARTSSPSDTITFDGERQDGSRVTQSFSLTGTPTVLNLTGFTNLSSMRWVNIGNSLTFDDVVLQTVDWRSSDNNFGSMALPGSISGLLYHDLNKNGIQDSGEPALSNRTVYLDINGDNQFGASEPFRQTAADGTYQFTAIDPGTYRVRQRLPTNWYESQPGSGYSVTLAAAQNINGRVFGSWADPVTITGRKWNDVNGNSRREPSEPGLSGWTVYIDSNDNSQLDAGEPSTVTSVDNPTTTSIDESGDYSFSGLIPGDYVVREVAQATWVQTSPLGLNLGTITGRPTGVNNGDPSYDQAISGNGRYLVYSSLSSLLPADTNLVSDVYLFDRETSTLQLISISNSGAVGNGASNDVTVSDDGRYVAYRSLSTNLFPSDTTTLSDIYLRDRQTNTTFLVSTGATAPANGASQDPVLSADGRTITFTSAATNLIANDVNQSVDVFMKDLTTSITVRINTNAGVRTLPDETSSSADMSADGRYVAYQSLSDDLVNADFNGVYDIFVLDRNTGVTERVSTNSFGIQSNGPSERPSISDDGRFVVFESTATNLTDDVGGLTGVKVYMKDRVTGETRLVSRSNTGVPMANSLRSSITSDGRWIAFESVSGGFNSLNIHLYDRLAGTMQNLTQNSSNNYYNVNANISRDGSTIVWNSSQAPLVSGGSVAILPVSRNMNAPGANRVKAFAGQTVGGNDIGNYQLNSFITGTQFNDINGNGSRDAGEAGLAGITVYSDLNNNTILDAGEPTALTNSSGEYTLGPVWPGDHVLRTLQTGERYQTSPAVPVNRLFGIYPVSDATSPTGTRFSLSEINPQTGAIISTIATAVPGTNAGGLAFDGERLIVLGGNSTLYEVLTNGQIVDQTPLQSSVYGGLAYLGGLVYYIAEVNGWPIITAFDTKTNQVVQRRNFSHSLDRYGGGVFFPGIGGGLGESADGTSLIATAADANQNDPRMLRIDPLTGRVTQYAPLNPSTPSETGVTGMNNELYLQVNSGASMRVYNSTGTFVRSFNINQAYQGLGGASTTDTAARVTLLSGQTLVQNFGQRSVNGTVAGRLYDDRNANGSRDAGEPDRAGATVYLDLNQNRRLDAAEPTSVTDAFGQYQLSGVPGYYTVRVVTPAGVEIAPTGTRQRLFGTRFNAGSVSITELDPITGVIVNEVAPPTPSNIDGEHGLAFDGELLYYVRATERVLYTLNPDTGAVLASMQLPPGSYAGLATIANKVYAINGGSILEIDPATSTVLRTMDINALNPNYFGAGTTINLAYSLSETADGTQLVAASLDNRAITINPNTGLIVSSVIGYFSGGAGGGGERFTSSGTIGPLSTLRVLDSQESVVRNATMATSSSSLAVGLVAERGRNVRLDRGASVANVNFAMLNIPELVQPIQFGDGTAQRSSIDRVVLIMDGPVDIDAGAFELSQRQRDALGTLVLAPVATAWSTLALPNGNTQVTLSFSGIYVRAGTTSLADGNYQLKVVGERIRASGTSNTWDADQNGTPGGTRIIGTTEADNFFSYFGDTNGDRMVGVAEFGAFRSTFGKSSSDVGYNALFDFDGGSIVGVGDFGAFRARFGKRLNFF